MHPILASRRRLVLYLFAWTPILALLAYVSRFAGGTMAGATLAGGTTWWAAAEVLAPSCLLFAFACLSPWYIGRAQPLRWPRLAELLFTWGAAGVAGGLLLVGGVWLAASVLRPTAAQ